MYQTNRRETKAMRQRRYAKAQWYAVDHEMRYAYHNHQALWDAIARGSRNPLYVQYVNHAQEV